MKKQPKEFFRYRTTYADPSIENQVFLSGTDGTFYVDGLDTDKTTIRGSWHAPLNVIVEFSNLYEDGDADTERIATATFTDLEYGDYIVSRRTVTTYDIQYNGEEPPSITAIMFAQEIFEPTASGPIPVKINSMTVNDQGPAYAVLDWRRKHILVTQQWE